MGSPVTAPEPGPTQTASQAMFPLPSQQRLLCLSWDRAHPLSFLTVHSSDLWVDLKQGASDRS